ncbi:ATP-binding protein [Kitasatospora mediocidica]|uniref:ATP-binding protein n=1 Tax=Kitasatospora mediocidica TaxID=58352 RepID=UPI000B243F50|nr:ATP-binding protein [Kitasatospora mediocidica]
MAQPSGDFSQENLRVRAGTLVSGRHLVTVGGPDGSDVQPCPPERRPGVQLLAADAQRQGGRTALGPGPSPAVGPLAMGAGPGDLPLLDREAEVAQLLGKLAEGRSIRLIGEQGSGCSALLSAVVEAAGDLAPHGVVQLCGHRRTAGDLLQDLFAATHWAPGFRPDREQLPSLLAQVGAIVVIDEVQPDGAELEELLATAPECAFLISVAAGSGGVLPVGSRLEDHAVGGLSRPACLALTARLAGRPLDDAERAWAVDLWFESEGLPLRFVQAAALLRQRDVEVDALIAAEEDQHSVFGRPDDEPADADPAVREGELRAALPLPSLAESAAPASRLAEGLSEPAQAVLRLSLALGGECPTAPHLPALIEVDHGESALRELADRGLAESIGGHHRLTAGVLEALAAQWPPQNSVHGAARHFSWWVGHGSVTTQQIAAEAEVVVGALEADRAAGRTDAVLRLARAAAPALALTLRWGAWRQVLELGLAVARRSGQQRDEAWFQHESGVHWLCVGAPDRARAALQAAWALRTELADVRGAAATRRLLTLLDDEARPPAATEAETQLVRRPVIRVLAARSLRSARVPVSAVRAVRGWSRRSLLLASGGLLVLGVLGTGVGLSVAGTDGSGPAPVQPSGSSDGTGLTGGAGLGGSGSPSGGSSATASATTTASASATASGAVVATATPSASPSASTTRGSGRHTTAPSSSAATTDAPTTDTPPAPGQTTGAPAPTQSSNSPAPTTAKPTTAPPTPSPTLTTASPTTPAPTASTTTAAPVSP